MKALASQLSVHKQFDQACATVCESAWETRRSTKLMRQDGHHLRLPALLYQCVVQHNALVLEETIPAHRFQLLIDASPTTH